MVEGWWPPRDSVLKIGVAWRHLVLGIYLLYAFASYAGGDVDTDQMERLIIACLSLGFLPLLIGVYSLIRSTGRKKKLDEKIKKFKN